MKEVESLTEVFEHLVNNPKVLWEFDEVAREAQEGYFDRFC